MPPFSAAVLYQFASPVVDAIGMALAMMGMLNPMLAALVHVGSEVAFLLNSARLLSASSLKAFGRR